MAGYGKSPETRAEESQVACTDVDGNAIAALLLEKCKRQISNEGLTPRLVVVQVGDDPASATYIKMQQKSCEKIGASFSHEKLLPETDTAGLVSKIQELNLDSTITGIIVQLPLPKEIDHDYVFEAIAREKDLDCVNPLNVGHLTQATPLFLPATPQAILHILTYHQITAKGKHCVVIGKSDIVGKPIALLMANEFGLACTVSMVDKYTESSLRQLLLASADIVIVAAGVHHLLKDPSCLKAGCVVIDVGIHRVMIEGKGKLQGDVDSNSVRSVCSLITPVPGGVGPVTTASLMANLVSAAHVQKLTDGSVQPLRPNASQARHEMMKGNTVSKLLHGESVLGD